LYKVAKSSYLIAKIVSLYKWWKGSGVKWREGRVRRLSCLLMSQVDMHVHAHVDAFISARAAAVRSTDAR